MVTSLPISAQSPLGSSAKATDFQSWNEVDFLTRLSTNLDVTSITRVRLSEQSPNPVHYVFGADWNFSVRKYLILTASFYYGVFRIASGTYRPSQGADLCGYPHVVPRKMDFFRPESLWRQV